MNIANGTILFRRVNSVSFHIDFFLGRSLCLKQTAKRFGEIEILMTQNGMRNMEAVDNSKLQFGRHKMWKFVSLSRLKRKLSAALRISNLFYVMHPTIKMSSNSLDPFRKLHGIWLHFFLSNALLQQCIWCKHCSGIFNLAAKMEGCDNNLCKLVSDCRLSPIFPLSVYNWEFTFFTNSSKAENRIIITRRYSCSNE